MAGKKAARYVTVGESTYAPGDEIPAEVVKLIDNPLVWVDPEAEGESDGSADKRSN